MTPKLHAMYKTMTGLAVGQTFNTRFRGIVARKVRKKVRLWAGPRCVFGGFSGKKEKGACLADWRSRL